MCMRDWMDEINTRVQCKQIYIKYICVNVLAAEREKRERRGHGVRDSSG